MLGYSAAEGGRGPAADDVRDDPDLGRRPRRCRCASARSWSAASGLAITAVGMLAFSTLDAQQRLRARCSSPRSSSAVGVGLAMTPATNAIVSSLPTAKQGVASAVNDTTREIGTALGIAIMGSMFNSGYRSGHRRHLARRCPPTSPSQARQAPGLALDAAAPPRATPATRWPPPPATPSPAACGSRCSSAPGCCSRPAFVCVPRPAREHEAFEDVDRHRRRRRRPRARPGLTSRTCCVRIVWRSPDIRTPERVWLGVSFRAIDAPLLAPSSTDEYEPMPPRARAAAGERPRTTDAADRNAPALDLEPADYLAGRLGTAATLRALDAAHGGGFYAVPPEAETDRAAADEGFAALGPVIDVQTHLVRPSRRHDRRRRSALVRLPADGRARAVDRPGRPDHAVGAGLGVVRVRRQRDVGRAAHVAPGPSRPGRDRQRRHRRRPRDRRPLRRHRPGAHPHHRPPQPRRGRARPHGRLVGAELRPAGWKVYTLWDPPGVAGPAAGSSTTTTGAAFLERVEALGPHIVCAHKGIAGPIPTTTPAAASPRDIGPAAAAYPRHPVRRLPLGLRPRPRPARRARTTTTPSAASADWSRASRPPASRPGRNVWAELGSTWFLMLRRPVEAAHVLGKLLLAVGPGPDPVGHRLGLVRPAAAARSTRSGRSRIPESDAGARTATRRSRPAVKRRILGGNAAQLYGIDPAPRPPERAGLDRAGPHRARGAAPLDLRPRG